MIDYSVTRNEDGTHQIVETFPYNEDTDVRTCDHTSYEITECPAPCPNEATREVAASWFCSLHYEEAHDAYQDFLSMRDV